MRMARLDPEARVAIRTLVSRGTSYSAIARLLNVTEGAVRYQVARMRRGQVDGRSAKIPKASCVGAAIDFWRESEGAGPGRDGLNVLLDVMVRRPVCTAL